MFFKLANSAGFVVGSLLFGCNIPTSSEQRDQMIQERMNSSEAKSCKDKGLFWEPAQQSCDKDFKLLSDDKCKESSIKAQLKDEDSQSDFSEMIRKGYEPIECGKSEKDGLTMMAVAFTKAQNEGVEFLTRKFFIGLSDDAKEEKSNESKSGEAAKDEKNNEAEASGSNSSNAANALSTSLIGAWKTTCLKGSEFSVEV